MLTLRYIRSCQTQALYYTWTACPTNRGWGLTHRGSLPPNPLFFIVTHTHTHTYLSTVIVSLKTALVLTSTINTRIHNSAYT